MSNYRQPRCGIVACFGGIKKWEKVNTFGVHILGEINFTMALTFMDSTIRLCKIQNPTSFKEIE